MLIPITIINPDESETSYASVDEMPASAIKTEISRLVNNPNLHLKRIVKHIK